MRDLGLYQRHMAAQLGLSQQGLSDRANGLQPWRLNELELAASTLEMDLTAILAPVDTDTSLSLSEPLDD
jgi:transcriptional regulator with XRE-family HTH domain